MLAQQKQEEADMEYLTRVEDNVLKTVPMLEHVNSQNLAVSNFAHGLCDQEFAMMTSIQAYGELVSALRFGASVTAY